MSSYRLVPAVALTLATEIAVTVFLYITRLVFSFIKCCEEKIVGDTPLQSMVGSIKYRSIENENIYLAFFEILQCDLFDMHEIFEYDILGVENQTGTRSKNIFCFSKILNNAPFI